ncbi:nitroreductase family protein [Geomonas sp. Red69]|uniref:nitroreductase family protein n=1 Tax=Geomonas diazotrophica TaxID=2843197 RepID=UPI001C1191FC|nr:MULTISPECIES: nitroreductase family protein [Geomonas]MBU5637283.1 nitroreductase family protein [Geomonas diazotrophica]QXE88746.1 nitroreductase family protein [Geomonas nitrogeniifigens]
MIELLRKRRSIRKFTDEKVSTEAMETLVEAALRAPASRSLNPWEFIVVDDPQLLQQLSRAKQHGSEFVARAPLAIVVCADSTKSDVWVEDCSIAAILVQCTALSLGLGSCWAQIRNRKHDALKSAEEYLQELLGLPEEVKVECILGIGHPAERPRPLPADKLQREKVRMNRWS